MQPTATPFSTSCRMVSRFSLHVRPGGRASVRRPAAAPARRRSAPVIASDALGVNASRAQVRLPWLEQDGSDPYATLQIARTTLPTEQGVSWGAEFCPVNAPAALPPCPASAHPGRA